MKHLDEGVLQQALDGELAAESRSEADLHLASCRRCQAVFAELRGRDARASALLGMLVEEPPLAAAHAEFTRRRRAGGRAVHPTRTVARRVLLKAALLVLTVTGAAVAVAVPGSPVREWISETVLAPREEARPVLAPEERPVAEAPAERAPTGVYILPDEGRVRVVLSAPSPDLTVRTRLTTEPRAEVYATGDAAGARFRTAPGRVEIVGAGPGEIHVALPATATAAYVEVDGRVSVAKEGDRLRVFAPGAESTAGETVFRVGG
jgi:hypothetical protein